MEKLSCTDPVLSDLAPAKVNLCLHVTGQRADGYHLLDSLICFAGPGDRLSARPAPAFSLQITGPFGHGLSAGEDNLVLRAARLAAPAFPIAFTLEKNLPLASGIGGGSSDAAAAVRLALRLQGHKAGPGADLLAALTRLGADIPVCLAPGAARMRGIGDEIERCADFPEGAILLVNPGAEVPTPAVFRGLGRKDNPALAEPLPGWRDLAALAGWLGAQRNDLEAPARQIAPVIGEVLAALSTLPGQRLSRMSGSGATCFALFDSLAEARQAEAALRQNHPGWWISAAEIA